MPSKIRQFGDLAKQFNQIVDAIAIDSGQIQTITQEGGLDSAAIIALIDSDHLATRQSFDFGLIGGRPATLSGYGITDAKTSAQQDSDLTATIDTVRDGVATELNDLNKMASAINDDADFFDAVKTYTLANAPLSVIQGNNYGYSYGGQGPSFPSNSYYAYTDRFAFSSDNNVSSYHNHIGGPRGGSSNAAAAVSSTHYYLSGGYTNPSPSYPYAPTFPGGIHGYWKQITKTALSTPISASDIGDLVEPLTKCGSHQSHTHGYVTGGNYTNGNVSRNYIQKFPFASDGDAATIGSLDYNTNGGGSHSTPHCGYVASGEMAGSSNFDAIQRFPLAADTNSTDVGDLGIRRQSVGSNSSDTHGYLSGGYSTPLTPPSSGANTDAIQKFPFAVSSATSTDVGDQTYGQIAASTAGNSTTHGYTKGYTGYNPSGVPSTYQKVSFASDANSVSVDSLRIGGNATGWQS